MPTTTTLPENQEEMRQTSDSVQSCHMQLNKKLEKKLGILSIRESADWLTGKLATPNPAAHLSPNGVLR